MPLFSIIIPVYNTERYLPECLDSLLAQTLGDWEAVLVNDGSTDGSPAVIGRYRAARPEKFRVVSQDNHGLLMARRAGFAAAMGDVIVSVDSDDFLRHDALERIAAAFQERPDADIVAYGFSREPDFSVMSSRAPFDEDTWVPREYYGALYQQICNTRTMNFMCTKAIRREAAQVGRDFSAWDGQSCAEDLLQSLPLLDETDGFYYLSDALYYYRVNSASLTKTFELARYWDNQRAGEVRLSYARKWEAEGHPGLVEGSLFMSLRETCETAIRVGAEFRGAARADALERMRAGALYQEAAACPVARARLNAYYRRILSLFEGHRDGALAAAARTGLALKPIYQKAARKGKQ